MEGKLLFVEKKDRICTLTLNRPEKRNASKRSVKNENLFLGDAKNPVVNATGAKL
jgi:1,4-dihydroxy-2-naphthoyl-CoA synthase